VSDPGVLYLVATPIGNLADLTLRAIETLRTVKRVAAEDTRQTRKLLSHLGVVGTLIEPLHAHSTDRDVARVISAIESGASIALVTDAGTPIVSDPGDALVRAAIARGIRVVPIPGPSAVLAALVASGFGGGGFRFFGFLPRDGAARHEAIARASATPETVVIFESPERTQATIDELASVTPERACAVARELTKMHEEVVHGTLTTLRRDAWRGEIVIVLGPHQIEETAIDDAALDARIDTELAAGTHAKNIAERLAAWSGRPKREVYERVIRRKNAG
jgi:16S rRNA (cytidine1402-2'-O)-methyltransferase